ncbi:MAG TPA: HD domain-containing protein [Candidatus Hydrogenedentes bacterium]|jgi:predicted HD superfamily hydrolase involved in NAD metabolism|nr:HD domain-containing protein [Candidatus Hydrogenedentota bacterium]HOD95893.1 HD domain-containing protein [Candidatus Hydrogenedentota bacterium]HOM46926.1 HD domain-containing protein [Candidatus Hydrogenedentota bacterium]HOR51329.1 HD domain-containing protein [Candidatus Hydrogenedentota bacterium]HPK24270.1 HD domain-containing protein [Candidatus Hydrogenedentota bacterium]
MPIIQEPTTKAYLKLLRERLSDARLSHTVFTAEYLSSFAPDLGLNHGDAVVAALFHDFYRDCAPEAMLQDARQLRISMSDCQLEEPLLLHGPLAAEWCRRELEISEAVYEAIYWHTTGRPGLGLLGQALYVADFAEPSRRFPEAEQARQLLRRENFRTALLFTTEIRHAVNQQKKVTDPNTEAFLLWLKTGGAA